MAKDAETLRSVKKIRTSRHLVSWLISEPDLLKKILLLKAEKHNFGLWCHHRGVCLMSSSEKRDNSIRIPPRHPVRNEKDANLDRNSTSRAGYGGHLIRSVYHSLQLKIIFCAKGVGMRFIWMISLVSHWYKNNNK